MEFYVERLNPAQDLGGLCECFISDNPEPGTVAKRHVHRHFELLYCLSGSYELTAGGLNCVLRKGDVVLIHPMEPHQSRSLEEGGNSYLVLKFMPEALYSVTHPLYEAKYIFPYLHFSEQRAYAYTADQLQESRLGELLLRILEERRQEAYGYEMALRAYVGQVLLWFLRAWNSNRGATAIDEHTLVRLQQALQYIEDHLDEDLKARDVAAALHMGVSTFSRFFAGAAGMSFPELVRSKRLGRAAVLLADSDRTVTEIALETGFATASYMILCFRRQYGVTPNQFRRLYVRDADRI